MSVVALSEGAIGDVFSQNPELNVGSQTKSGHPRRNTKKEYTWKSSHCTAAGKQFVLKLICESGIHMFDQSMQN